jgi:GR25 family glycosyltransferase involved in LPS biosynthesis
MRCVYINLGSRTDRKAALEANFEANKAPEWTLSRLEAIRADQSEVAALPGPANPREKACFMSHRSAIAEHCGGEEPFMVLEDDAMFGPRSCVAIERVTSNLAADSWDILFTDVAVANVGAWADIIRIRRQHFAKTGEMRLVDLAGIDFAGSTAYVVNPASAAKVLGLFSAVGSLDCGIDLYMRDLTHRGALRCIVPIPFLTTISELSALSSIQMDMAGSAVPLLDLFRRMIWLHRDLGGHLETVRALRSAHIDAEGEMFATLFGVMVSETIRW